MSICPCRSYTEHPGYCQKQTWGQTLCVHPGGPAACCGLARDEASTSDATSWSPVSDRARSCCAQLGPLGICKEGNWDGHPHTQEPVQAQATLCPLCQVLIELRKSQGSSSWCCNNADPMGKIQLSHPSGPSPKSLVLHHHYGAGAGLLLSSPCCPPPTHALCNGSGVGGSCRDCSETRLILERPGAMRSCQTHPLPKSRLRPGLAHLQS